MQPVWWDWEIELSVHVLKRMVERRFSEVDLRRMMDSALNCYRARQAGRWIVEARHGRRSWRIILEPDLERELIVVVTAYPVN